jgi:type I restriction enzyme M protein
LAKRHAFRPGDWETVARRLDEIISATSGEDAFQQARGLLVAKLEHEASHAEDAAFLSDEAALAAQVDRLLQAACRRWPGIVEDSARTLLREPELARCAPLLRSVSLHADDLGGLDAIFELIVSRAAKGQKGQFFTPRHVIAAIVDMLRPQPGEWVVDPACGSGGFLHHAWRLSPGCQPVGFDADLRAVQVARIVLSAAGADPARIQRLDSLRRPGDDLSPAHATPCIESVMPTLCPGWRGFDVVLTNPPFAGDVGDEYAARYELAQGRRVERDVLFAERCLGLLRPGGRLGIVLPQNKFSSAAWAGLRRWLLLRLQDVAVISLGRTTFLPHTSQKACVLIGRKRRCLGTDATTQAPPRGRVLFFVSEQSGKDESGRLQTLDSQAACGVDGRASPARMLRPRVEHDLDQATPLVQRHLAEGERG